MDINHISTPKKPIFYGLLYIDAYEQPHVNLRGTKKPLDVYLKCAELCAVSVNHHGFAFTLITNNKEFIEQRLAIIGHHPINIKEVKFDLDVPRDIQFYAAHFKLEIYHMFGTGEYGDFIGLIDIDTVMLNMPDFSLFREGHLLGYDITDQVASVYGNERIRSDIEFLTKTKTRGIYWWGGEFLFGRPETFKILSDTIIALWPRYLANIERFHHVGDEMIVSSALSLLVNSTVDVGCAGLIARWWSSRTEHCQPTFEMIKNCGILHLPSDKNLLTLNGSNKFDPAIFQIFYKKSISKKLLYRRIFNVVDKILRQKTRYVARIK